jgi:hypothetical protein
MKTVNMMESFTTYACHGTLTLNVAMFAELEEKSDEENSDMNFKLNWNPTT